MTRLQAIQSLRRGEKLIKIFRPEWDGVECELEVWIQKQNNYIYLRFWSRAIPNWIRISPKQLLGFIRRNYFRKVKS